MQVIYSFNLIWYLKDKKSTRRVSVMLKRTKSANQSVLADAVNNDHTAITMTGNQQPDEDDYGYVSQEAADFYNKMMEKYNKMPDEPKFPSNKKKINTNLNSAKERVIAALEREKEEANMPHKRRRKHEVVDERDFEESKPIPQHKPKPKCAPPLMNFADLLKVAEKKQHEPIVIEKKKEVEEERPLTKKQKKELERQKEYMDRKVNGTPQQKPPTINRIPKLSSNQDKSKPADIPVSSKTNVIKPAIQNVNGETKSKAPVENKRMYNHDVQRKVNDAKVVRREEIRDSKPVERPPVKYADKNNKPEDRLRKPNVPSSSSSNGYSNNNKQMKRENLQNKTNPLEKKSYLFENSKQLGGKTAPKQDIVFKKPLATLNNGKPKECQLPDVRTKKPIDKPKQFPPRDLKPKQFPPADVRRREDKKKMLLQKSMAFIIFYYLTFICYQIIILGRILDDDEEEYDSEMDDFIDDGPQEDFSNDYSKYISEIFGYDKSKYKYADDDDDNMESTFAQQMREEVISTKIGMAIDYHLGTPLHVYKIL